MAIPDYQFLMRPVLALLADGQAVRTRTLKKQIADALDLTDQERHEMLPSGRTRVIDSRVSWAITYLAQAGLIDKPSRGIAVINDRGRTVLAEHPTRIDNKVLEQFPEFLAFKNREREVAQTPLLEETPSPAPEGPLPPRVDTTPEELVNEAIARNRALVRGEVLTKALNLSPTGFEDLVIALLSAMGYGRAGSVERTSTTGDAGIDGIISQDPLGLDRIYVQAKRYAEDRPVERPKIHEFAGALLGRQGDRGVFITTSRFTQGARLEAERINARIELIDGERLAALLVDYGVGVQTERTITLCRLDEDFFESL